MDADDLAMPHFRHAAATITVLIVSSRQSLLSAWGPQLAQAPGIELHAELLTDPARLRQSLVRRSPAVLLLDQALLDGLDARSLRAMRDACCERTCVLLLADSVSNGLLIDVVRLRFHGFLLTTCAPEVSLKAIRAVSRGELWLSRAALASLLARLLPTFGSVDAAGPPPSAGSNSEHPLTRREQQIVELLRRGCSNKEIAHELGVMEDTVKKHLQAVFGKLGVRRRALVALRPGLATSQLSG
jgi:DNA-binding NarL/FixJ family response regulator